MNFNAGEAMSIAESFSFPRAVGSRGEERAASFIESKLLESGYRPQREEFCIPLTPWAMMKGLVFLAMLLAMAARGLAVLSPISSSIVMLLIVIALAFYPSFWLKFAGSDFFCRRFSGREKEAPVSQNVVARLPASQKPENFLYLVAHYDSKNQSLSPMPLLFCLLLSGFASLWLSFVYLWAAREMLPKFPSWPIDLPLTLAMAGMMNLLFLRTGNRSPGGLDNAGSVGVLLHMADVLKRYRPLRSEIVFLFSGAEELGLQGAFAYLQKHGKEINRENTYFLNLDCVGITGKIKIFPTKGFWAWGKESPFGARMKEIGQSFKIGIQSFTFGFLMDHHALMAKGYPAVTLACPSKKILKVHTPDDTAALLDKEGMEEACKFVGAWIESWEKGGADPKGVWPSRPGQES